MTFREELRAVVKREMDRPGAAPADLTTALVEQLSTVIALATLGQGPAWRGVVATVVKTLPEMVFVQAGMVRGLIEEQADGPRS